MWSTVSADIRSICSSLVRIVYNSIILVFYFFLSFLHDWHTRILVPTLYAPARGLSSLSSYETYIAATTRQLPRTRFQAPRIKLCPVHYLIACFVYCRVGFQKSKCNNWSLIKRDQYAYYRQTTHFSPTNYSLATFRIKRKKKICKKKQINFFSVTFNTSASANFPTFITFGIFRSLRRPNLCSLTSLCQSSFHRGRSILLLLEFSCLVRAV